MLRVKLYKDDGEFTAYWKPYYGTGIGITQFPHNYVVILNIMTADKSTYFKLTHIMTKFCWNISHNMLHISPFRLQIKEAL